MDAHKMHVKASKSTFAQSFSSLSMSGCTNGIIDASCTNEHPNVGFNCNKETFIKNSSSKAAFNNNNNSNNNINTNNPRGTNNTNNATYGSAGSNTSGYCSSSNSSASGNYYKVLPVSLGNVQQQQQQHPQHMQNQQYNRKKPTQEYQSRLYNNTDYKCRDDFYSLGNNVSSGGRISLTSPSPSLQLQQQYQHHHHHHHQQQQQHSTNTSIESQQQQQQISVNHQQHSQHVHSQQQQHHQNSLRYQQSQQQYEQSQQHDQQQQQQGQHYLHNHHSHHSNSQQQQQQTTNITNYGDMTYSVPHHICMPTNVNNDNDDVGSNLCSMVVNQSKRMVASTQTPLTENCNAIDTLTSPGGGLTINGAPAIYSLHRVVNSAQVQTAAAAAAAAAAANAFTSSSSISSVMSTVRNEADCLQLPGTIAAPNSLLSDVSGTDNMSANFTNCMNNNNNNNNELPTSSSGLMNTTFRGLNVSNSSCLGQTHQQRNNNLTSRLANNNNFGHIGASTSSSSSSSANTTNYLNGTHNKTMYSPQPRVLENVSTGLPHELHRSLMNVIGQVIPTCVYLMSRVAVHMEIEGTAQCPTQLMLAAALGCEELGIANKLLAQSIFALWMVSPLLEIQLKAHHCPYVVRLTWFKLLQKFSNGSAIDKSIDEPMITLRRNVFFSKRDEEKIKDHRILELLYEEAKHNVLTGRYIMESVHALMLGGIQARIELGPYNAHLHTISFFRESQTRFLPNHVAKSSSWSWFPVSRRSSAEVKLLDQFKRVPQTTTTRKLMRKYLEFCWALPFYGAAFFHGQVEQPVRGVMSLLNQKDLDVEVAVNERGIFIIDNYENTLLLGLRYEDFSWDYAKPSSNDPECLTCIFLQFNAIENGIQFTKLMQVFSKQAAMIDALISHFADQMRKRRLDAHNGAEQVYDEPNPIQNNGQGVLSNKLSCLTLATFDEEGRCIGQMGTLSISF